MIAHEKNGVHTTIPEAATKLAWQYSLAALLRLVEEFFLPKAYLQKGVCIRKRSVYSAMVAVQGRVVPWLECLSRKQVKQSNTDTKKNQRNIPLKLFRPPLDRNCS